MEPNRSRSPEDRQPSAAGTAAPPASPRPDGPAETAVKALYDSLTEAQKREVCFPWDYQDPRRGLLRSFVSNHWYVTRPFIRDSFFTKEQQAIIHDIFTSLINPEWYGRFLKQMKDDSYGQDWGEEQSLAIFGTPGTRQFQFVLTGRHMTLRADGGSEGRLAFGGPIVYGHAAGGCYTEKPHHPGNVFWYQAEMANRVYQTLEPEQRSRAVVDRLPPETALEFQEHGVAFPGIAVADFYPEQKAELEKVLRALLDPFRTEDQVRILECLQTQGGLDRCHLAFYREGRLSGPDTWDNWRLEGPAFVWYFRGSPHVHVWVNVADTPAVPLNARVRFVVDPMPPVLRLQSQPGAGKTAGRKLVAISTVKNEIDIIEPFVRHTLAFVDHLVIADNGSTDGTLDVLRALEREGLPLTVSEDPSAGKYLSQRMTRLMHEQAITCHGADWVLPVDADEFLLVPEGASLIPESASSEATIALPWRTYVPDPSDDPAKLNPVLRLRHRLVQEGWPWVKVLVPRKLAACPDAVLTQGNHLLTIGGRPCPAVAGKACLAHFPIRGPGQYLAKVAISAFQHHAMGAQGTGLAFHWRAPYELLKRDPDAFAASVFEDARRFSVPPQAAFQPATVVDRFPYRGGPLLHTAMVDDRARGWQAVVAYTEQLAHRYAVLMADLSAEERVLLERRLNAIWNAGPEEPLLLRGHLELRRQHQAVQKEFAECRQEAARLAGELDQSRQQAACLGAELARSRQESACFEAELQRCRGVIQALRRSWTWRVGALVVRPASRALRWLRLGQG
jgi:hypothetical protein